MRIMLDELRLRRISLLVWTLAVMATIAMTVLLYPSIGANAGYEEIMANMPPELQSLFGGASMSTPSGYLSVELFSFFLPAILIAYAVGRGAATVAGEEEGHTLDLLLAQPVARISVYLQKALAMAIGVAVLTAASWLSLVLLRGPADMAELELGPLTAVCLQMGLLALTFGVVALAVAVATGSRAVGMAVSGGYAFLSFLLEGLGPSVSWLDPWRPLSPWNWFGADKPLLNGFDVSGIAVSVGVAAAVAVLGLWAFERRDLHA
jgi:ABC-2 type transport system permease protein